ncbi:hypothetical protein BWI17_08535 [Betaproteobacteria bacterium GR16-43]|nr:hypothetical protein BWI17_08535 [Betaproteobacteria bacterium GR16-43]
MANHYLYLTNTRMVSLTARGGRLVARREFAVSGEGMEDFERHLKGLREIPTRVITDLIEEDFRLDTIPHVGFRDREAIISRKLAQIFRGTPYKYAMPLGREPEGRRDDRVLYTAITNAEVLRPWLEAIERLHVPLAGIHSAAVFSGNLLAALDLVFPQTLLVTFTPGEAVRQTYFRDREIRFSRLTPVDLEPGQTLGSMLAEETTRTWQYLDSLRHFGQDDRLEVCVLVHPKDRPSIEPALRDFAQIQYRLLDIEQVAAKLGLKPPPLGSSAEEVLVHLFLRKPVPNHFASPELRADATRRRARLLINQASIGILALGVGWGGFVASQVLRADTADKTSLQQLQSLNREYDEIVRSLPSRGVGGAAMRESVAFYNGNLRGFPSLLDFMLPISQVLEVHPRVQLMQFAWQTASDAAVTPTLTSTTPRDAPPVRTTKRDAPVAPPVESPDAPFANGRFQVALIEATVRMDGVDFRAALGEVDQLAVEIGKVPGYRADVVDSPLDMRPGVGITGKLDEREAATSEARFTLRVVRERAAP